RCRCRPAPAGAAGSRWRPRRPPPSAPAPDASYRRWRRRPPSAAARLPGARSPVEANVGAVTDAAPIPAAGDESAEQEQRASWLELFFDLVVVVAVAVLAERLREDAGLVDVALVLEMYLAVWLVWVSFMLYANVAGNRTHQNAVIVAMGCIAVMAASIPGVHAGAADRGRYFAIAYVG